MEIIVETYRNPGEPSTRPIRVRPLTGQFDREYHVWCSVAMRKIQPIGSLFRVHASLVHQPQGDDYLRIGLHSPWVPATIEAARQFVINNNM